MAHKTSKPKAFLQGFFQGLSAPCYIFTSPKFPEMPDLPKVKALTYSEIIAKLENHSSKKE